MSEEIPEHLRYECPPNAPLERAMDVIFDMFDILHRKGEFQASDVLLQNIIPHHYPTTLLLTFLTITRPAAHKLPSRHAFYLKCKDLIEKRDKKDCDRLLENLEMADAYVR